MISNKIHPLRPVEALPYSRKDGPDYKSLPIGKARQRKIDHVRSLLKRPKSKRSQVWEKAIHHMNMPGSDIVEAFKETN